MPITTRSNSNKVVKGVMLSKRSIENSPISIINNNSKKGNTSNTGNKKKRQKKSNNDKDDDINSDNSIVPWYTYFTKGDLEYDEYMKNEWCNENLYYNNENLMFEMLSLEGAQSGLSWYTILKKRQGYRNLFHNFNISKVSQMTSNDIDIILNNKNSIVVVRHRGKLESIINNAKCIIQMKQVKEIDNFANYIWSFVNYKPILNHNEDIKEMPTKSIESEIISKTLKKKYGFKFVGPTTCYSLMQAVGMVIDHPINTPEWKQHYNRLQQRTGGYQDHFHNN